MLKCGHSKIFLNRECNCNNVCETKTKRRIQLINDIAVVNDTGKSIIFKLIVYRKVAWELDNRIVLGWMPQKVTIENATSVRATACYRQEIIDYLA